MFYICRYYVFTLWGRGVFLLPLIPWYVGSNWWKGQWNFDSNKERAAVFINIEKNGFTHENLCQYSNIVLFCCFCSCVCGGGGAYRLSFLLLFSTFIRLSFLNISFVFNTIFTIIIPIICASWICENDFCMSYYLKILSMEEWQTYFETPCIKLYKTQAK